MSHPRVVWDDGRELTRELSRELGNEHGPAVVALGAAVALTVIVVNVAMVGRVSMFFDLWFVLLCLGLALLVRPRDFFTVGVLPPLIMVGSFAVLAVDRPEAIAAAGDSVVQAVVSGLAHHSVALVSGYALCLLTLFARQRAGR